ncbi:MAG: glycerophosphodiester phosphodiesterase [Candidatus Kapaibacteriales bacterium]
MKEIKPLRDFFNEVDFLIVAHRGSSGTAPENTLASFELAINSNAHFIELDLQVTRDGIPIAFHDKWISRTTNGIGQPLNITFVELRQFDCGFWFSSEFKGEKIPSLEEVLSFIQNRIYLNIEIKNLGTNPSRNLEKIISTICNFDYQEKVVISSFYYDFLKLVRKFDNIIPTAAIRIPKDRIPPSQIAKNLNCQGFICSISEIDKEIILDAKANNLFVGVYSIDSEEELDMVVKLECNAIVTNFPQKIRELLVLKYNVKV